jgi:predicted metalloprotease
MDVWGQTADRYMFRSAPELAHQMHVQINEIAHQHWPDVIEPKLRIVVDEAQYKKLIQASEQNKNMMCENHTISKHEAYYCEEKHIVLWAKYADFVYETFGSESLAALLAHEWGHHLQTKIPALDAAKQAEKELFAVVNDIARAQEKALSIPDSTFQHQSQKQKAHHESLIRRELDADCFAGAMLRALDLPLSQQTFEYFDAMGTYKTNRFHGRPAERVHALTLGYTDGFTGCGLLL